MVLSHHRAGKRLLSAAAATLWQQGRAVSCTVARAAFGQHHSFGVWATPQGDVGSGGKLPLSPIGRLVATL